MMNSVLFRTGRGIALAAFAVLLTVGSAQGQAGRIEGTVTNAVTGDPLAGAVIAVRGTPISVTTNDQGSFVIAEVAPGTVSLTIRLIGYQVVIVTRQPVSTAGTTLLNFRLQPSVLRLNEIVVTGVAEATQGVKLAFTVDVLNANDLVVVPTGTPEEAIRGKIAGAKVVRASGEPGGGVSVLLRGGTSIDVTGRTNEPLYVVDGVILGASMVDIDALSIQSIEVLKGAAASSLYGARAANGVIAIRTNRGANLSQDETRVVARAEFGANYLGNKVGLSRYHAYLVDPNGTCDIQRNTSTPGVTETVRGTCWIDAAGDPVTRRNRKLDKPFGVGGFQDNEYQGELFDHLDLFFDPGTFSTQSLSVAHRTGPTNFNSTFSRTQEAGIVSGLEGYDRKSFRVNLDHSLADDLEVSVSVFYSNSSSDGSPSDPNNNAPNPFFGLMFLERDNDLLQPNDDGEPFIIRPDPNSLEENPLYLTHNVDFELRRSRSLGNMRVRWFPVRGFDLEADFSFDRSDRNRFEFYHKGFKNIESSALEKGRVERNNSFDQALNASLTARYSTRFGAIGSTSSARALVERSEFEQFFARAQDLIVNNVNDLDVGSQPANEINSSSQNVRSLGYFISQDFDISDRYILSGLIRRDGSSLFGVDERWHTYYRLGGAYRVAQESWWPIGFVNEFKLRYSRGTAGGRPRFTAQYEVFSVSGGQVSKGSLGNVDLKPEFATEDEFGFDMILGGRVQLTGTYALSRVQDQILRAPLPGFFGFSTQWQNAGTLQSKTFEASLQADLISTRNVSWNFSVVWDRTRQKITEFDIPAFRFGGVFYNREGEDFGTLYGSRFMTDCSQLAPGASCANWGVNSDGYLVPIGSGNTVGDGISKSLWGTDVADADGTVHDWGMPVVQDSVLPDGSIGSDFLRIGNTTPSWNFGFAQTFRLKNLSLYALFDAQVGGDVYNSTKQWGFRDSRHADADQFGKPDGLKKPADYYKKLYNTNASSSAFVEDATFLKFRELSIRYAFNQGALQNIMGGFINRLTLSVVGRNIFTWTGYSGFDPEVGSGGSNAAIQRRDNFAYPNYRTFTGAIEIAF